jgi:hypothetical protein
MSRCSIRLSSIELALLAELNLQMAHAYDEEAEDPRNPLEARQRARDRGSRLRDRSRMFQQEARRVGHEGALTVERERVYAGPERRRDDRRTSDRRSHGPVPPDRLPAGHDRRTNPDRRRDERRRWPGRA